MCIYKFSKYKMKNKKGFTLIELIVVIAIVAVLAAVGIPAINTQVSKSTQATMEKNARLIAEQAEIMYKDKEEMGTGDIILTKDEILTGASLNESKIGTVTINQEEVKDEDNRVISHRVKNVKVEKGSLTVTFGRS